MTRTRLVASMFHHDFMPFCRARKRLPRPSAGQASARCRLRLEQLEDRVVPSLLGTFELDGNVTTGVLGTSGSTTTSHDWDQVFADNGVMPPPASGALASTFVTDAVNTNSDDIFTGGGSKDTQGTQSGQWLFTSSRPQGKNDITHAYAAAYTDLSNGHLDTSKCGPRPFSQRSGDAIWQASGSSRTRSEEPERDHERRAPVHG